MDRILKWLNTVDRNTTQLEEGTVIQAKKQPIQESCNVQKVRLGWTLVGMIEQETRGAFWQKYQLSLVLLKVP